MEFSFSEEHLNFLDKVDQFIKENGSADVMDVQRENIAMLCDTPERRKFMKKIGQQGWLGLTWPIEYGGKDTEGIYEFLLNEKLAGVGAPQIGKGVGFVGKTLIRHGTEKLKHEFLPKIINAEIEFAIGYSEPNAGSDAAAMQLKATRDGDGWRFNGQKVFTTSAHFAEWYWLAARTDPSAPKHKGITLFLVELDQPGITVHPMPTIGGEQTNVVFLDNVYVHDDYRVGDENRGFQYISEALDLERFTLFTFSPIKVRLQQLIEYTRTHSRGGQKLIDDPWTRQKLTSLITRCEVARLLGLRCVDEALKSNKPPTSAASMYKLFSTELAQDLASAMMDISSPSSQLLAEQPRTAMNGRPASTYASTVVDTIGGGTSEVQRNIIARHELGLPRSK